MEELHSVAKVLGLESYSIEIDEQLSNLQNDITKSIPIDLTVINDDAIMVDYNKLNLNKPVFFIGGLPENGEMLADSIIKNILNSSELQKTACFALTGTLAERKFARKPVRLWLGHYYQKIQPDYN